MNEERSCNIKNIMTTWFAFLLLLILSFARHSVLIIVIIKLLPKKTTKTANKMKQRKESFVGFVFRRKQTSDMRYKFWSVPSSLHTWFSPFHLKPLGMQWFLSMLLSTCSPIASQSGCTAATTNYPRHNRVQWRFLCFKQWLDTAIPRPLLITILDHFATPGQMSRSEFLK